MARIKKRGQFSGKMSNVVFATWNGIEYVRAPPTWKKKYKATPKQLLNQQKFRFGMKLVNDFRELLFLSVEFEKGQSSASSAMRTLLNDAITGVHPNLSVDYSKMLVAKGSLPPVTGATVESTGTGIKFSWTDETDTVHRYHYQNNSILVVYCPDTNDVFYDLNGPKRFLLSGELKLSDYWKGKLLHTWLAFRSADSKLKSNSVYTGELRFGG